MVKSSDSLKIRQAAGFFVYRLEPADQAPSFSLLLLHSARHQEWGMPKGHWEQGDEDLLATAQRELEEETGIQDLLVHSGFRAKLCYRVSADIKGQAYQKELVYFLGSYQEGELRLSQEHDRYQWVCEEQVAKYLKHRNLIKLFERAMDYLRERREKS